MTSIKKRLDHVLNELDELGTESDEETAKNIIAELSIINSAYRETTHVPMCCFRYGLDNRVSCDVAGPLRQEQFMVKCRLCQSQIKQTLYKLRTN